MLTLPKYPGCHDVAVSHFEVKPLAGFSHGLLASLFYPTDMVSQPRAEWLPGPSKYYAMGYGDFIKMPQFITRNIFAGLMGSVSMPAIKSSVNTPLPKAFDPADRLPLVVFSHGLGGNQTTYSTFVGTLASRGFVCLSVEHRDQSASVSAKNGYQHTVHYLRPENGDKKPDETNDEYLRRLRETQVKKRVEEVKEGVELLKKLDAGLIGADDFIFGHETIPQLKGRLDIDNMIMAGHSFGGATGFMILQDPETPFIAGILLDPWMYTVKDLPLQRPILTIQADIFHWRSNLDAILGHLNRTPTLSPLENFGVVLGTRHQEVSDLSLIAPYIMSMLKVSGNRNPLGVHAVYDIEVSRFLRKVLVGRSVVAEEYLPDCEPVDKEHALFGKEAVDYLNAKIPMNWEDTQ